MISILSILNSGGGLKNDLTIYCQSQNVQRIKSIRNQFGLGELTHIRVLDEFKEIEPEMYRQMCKIEEKKKFQEFRYYKNALSNKADYDYVMCMKWWCLMDAASREESSTMMAWLDFGYNHGGERYVNSKDFNFTWDFDFPEKINVFCLSNPDDMCAIDSLQFQADCFIGHTAVMPAKLCDIFYKYIREAMFSLIALDCIDDDQQLELMVYKRYPDLFNVTICSWFEDMELCSYHDFDVKEKKKEASGKKWLNIKQAIGRAVYRLTSNDDFIRRSKERKKLYIKS